MRKVNAFGCFNTPAMALVALIVLQQAVRFNYATPYAATMQQLGKLQITATCHLFF
jgi:hypothetical protein